MASRHLVAIVAAFALAGSPAVLAHSSKRQAKAHVHGAGKMAIAIDGATISIELEAPAADIVGFEHAGKTKAQQEALARARASLSAPLSLFRPSEAAGCKVQAATVEHKLDTTQAKSDDTHAEFEGRYTLACTDMSQLTSLAFDYFKAFPDAGRLDVILIGPKGQSKFEVSRAKPVLGLAGMM
jgi:hypothetical protein